MTPITKARTGFFDPAKALIAIRRGAAMNVDLNDGWDYWPVMGEQVEELRRRYNILPAEAFLLRVVKPSRLWPKGKGFSKRRRVSLISN